MELFLRTPNTVLPFVRQSGPFYKANSQSNHNWRTGGCTARHSFNVSVTGITPILACEEFEILEGTLPWERVHPKGYQKRQDSHGLL